MSVSLSTSATAHVMWVGWPSSRTTPGRSILYHCVLVVLPSYPKSLSYDRGPNARPPSVQLVTPSCEYTCPPTRSPEPEYRTWYTPPLRQMWGSSSQANVGLETPGI